MRERKRAAHRVGALGGGHPRYTIRRALAIAALSGVILVTFNLDFTLADGGPLGGGREERLRDDRPAAPTEPASSPFFDDLYEALDAYRARGMYDRVATWRGDGTVEIQYVHPETREVKLEAIYNERTGDLIQTSLY